MKDVLWSCFAPEEQKTPLIGVQCGVEEPTVPWRVTKTPVMASYIRLTERENNNPDRCAVWGGGTTHTVESHQDTSNGIVRQTDRKGKQQPRSVCSVGWRNHSTVESHQDTSNGIVRQTDRKGKQQPRSMCSVGWRNHSYRGESPRHQ